MLKYLVGKFLDLSKLYYKFNLHIISMLSLNCYISYGFYHYDEIQ